MRPSPSVWPAITLVLMAYASIFAPECTQQDAPQAKNRSIPACKGKKTRPIVPPLQKKQIVPGAIPTSFIGLESSASITIPLEFIPGRADMEPAIVHHYNSDKNFDNGLGVGFSLNEGSSITRRNKTMAINGTIDVPHFDDTDAFAINGKPLVVVSQQIETFAECIDA